MECIRYAEGYKYQLRDTYRTQIEIRPSRPIKTPWVDLDCDGLLTINFGYAWDGPSGPTIDTLDSMRGSLVHDALYQLMREGYLDHDEHRPIADLILRRICLEDGMWEIRADAWYVMVCDFGSPAADPAKASPDKWAPAQCAIEVASEAAREAA